jgi:hypothetical protein
MRPLKDFQMKSLWKEKATERTRRLRTPAPPLAVANSARASTVREITSLALQLKREKIILGWNAPLTVDRLQVGN